MRPLYWYKKRKTAGMPVIAELVLDMVSDKEPMSVMSLVNEAVDEGYASHSTIHSNLTWLATYGYIKMTVNSDDARLRVCTPTDKARRYLGAKNAV